jgi:tRNA(fMet)-specific endonuclease VapC
MACLDTTVILDLLGRAGPRRREAAEAKLKQLEHDQPHSVTRFTLAELLIGVELADDSDRERVRLDRILSRFHILEFDDKAMRLYARLFVHLRTLGQLSGIVDMLIASVCLSQGQRFVTRNVRHFQNVPGLRMDSY